MSNTLSPMFPEVTGLSTPIFTSMEEEFGTWLERRIRFDTQVNAYDRLLESLGINSKVDEVAIMVRDEHAEYHLIEQAVRNGFTVFNAAEDAVETSPIESAYKVHYTFLQHPEDRYRIEVMRMLEGVSPLHDTLGQRAKNAGHNLPIVVHASFKTQSIEEMGQAEQILLDADFDMVQACRSTYGAFAYYSPASYAETGAGFEVYLKPRVNMRDAA